MMRATPVAMRRTLEAARTYAEHGVLFVPVPVFDEADHTDLVRQVDERIEAAKRGDATASGKAPLKALAVPLTVDLIADRVAEALGEALDCTRVWSAWGVGTMSADDFALVAEDSERVAEIAQAAIDASQPAYDALRAELAQVSKLRDAYASMLREWLGSYDTVYPISRMNELQARTRAALDGVPAI